MNYLERIGLALANLGSHEKEVCIRVLEETAERLHVGQRQYGPFDPKADSRDWVAERRAERIDGAVYDHFADLCAEHQTGR